MPLTSRQIADKLREILPQKQPAAYDAVYDLLLLSLSPRQRQVYDYVVARQGTECEWITSAGVCRQLDIKSNNAGNVLNQLHNLGLLKREPTVDEGGLRYLWAVA
jgi:predicted transcriptional regulator